MEKTVTAQVSRTSHNELSFQSVNPVSISVRGLSVTVKAEEQKGGFFSRRKKKTSATEKQTTAESISIDDKSAKKEKNKKSQKKKEKESDDVEPQARDILSNISLDIPAGSIMAILGGSGSGKTSLLNMMASRMSGGNLTVEGETLFDGKSIEHVTHAYVIQQDILSPHLTCRETLNFAAGLRLDKSINKVQRSELVEEVIKELNLKECADTMVGNSIHRGLSGGEKRRLSIGIQMLSNPSVLFLDEPTTGLDANSAFDLVKTMKNLSLSGRTLIMSIHQPRSDIFFLFDHVTILSRGLQVYSGSTKESINWFASLGYDCPRDVNPADYLIDIAAVDTRSEEDEEQSFKRINAFVDKYNELKIETGISDVSGTASKSSSTANLQTRLFRNSFKTALFSSAPLGREIDVQVRRTWLIMYRDKLGIVGLTVEAILMGLICGLVFLRMKPDLAGIRSMEGAAYIAISLQGYLMLLYETYRLCATDLAVFDREHNEGCASVFGFLIARRMAKLFTEDLIVPIIFSVLTYFLFGFRTDGAKYFFIYFAQILLTHHISMNFSMVCAALSRDYTIASLVANLMFTLQSMASGFFANSEHMKVYIRWTKWITYVFYGLSALLNNQFMNFFGDCPYGNKTADDPLCKDFIGENFLESVGFPRNFLVIPTIALLCWLIVFFLLSWLLLTIIRVDVGVGKNLKGDSNKAEKPEAAEKVTTIASVNRNPPLTVAVSDLKLSVTKLRAKEKPILDGINAIFRPGSISAILGPSGSGKSSLLNLMANRLNSTLTQKYTASGDIFLNSTSIGIGNLGALCSFVTQEDDGLLSTLTVRETLYFSAYLRLPDNLTREMKRRRADELILKMGLKDCQDTLIGDDNVKGISGGEKRRVSICVQLLSNPDILLLDEPTSGLDSFTAGSILQVLQTLAQGGKTVICTIHQPRSDLFGQFGSVLLLSKGGHVAYDGQAKNMVQYFSDLGYPCPDLTNPADHVLDLVSVNLQMQWREDEDRERVDKLLSEWHKVEKQLFNAGLLRENSASFDPKTLMPRKPAPFQIAYFILLQRGIIALSRSPQVYIARLTQPVGIGVVLVLFFTPLRSSYIGIFNRFGLVQQLLSLYFVGVLNNMASYPFERDVFYREQDDGLYGVLPFFAVYTTLEIPFEVVSAMVFCIIVVLPPGFPRTADFFFAAFYLSFVVINTGESIGIVFNTLFRHTGFALNVVSVILSVGVFMAGLLSLQMPDFFKGLNYISPLKYACQSLLVMAFKDVPFHCTPDTGGYDAMGNCIFTNGTQVLEAYGFKNHVRVYLGVAAVCLVLYRLVSLVILKLVRLRVGLRSLKSRDNV
ncbi:P-loop containing nucleoside triphosphate hydrolase protein [Yarrowia lipolytica]|jgi:ABC-type multidrug transport system ATPase subunit|uniref:YALI0D25828p n=2 Tax=Yarrowia lipolytica TaxID=4952 RepID=Q6C7S1_YARLI|nr:YALI0D25828p [Yarrowia lipolytica CLIB122]RDW23145.1 P-loop containing nucleoside triphosphate hydrolase protein [Yarrowia lipolytica]RDW31086.1 P-loop containing nucleoside triphosphate hydrolase protein [Yarrowia lipolytica]RDW36618.1 P-loop containing nucleoside triphosphate hydrolase protein [Yarrowia lipolytica]CAG81495.1 YALI0D25828p [Yarrowia lipolytica CLIB122]VBB88550.1 ABC transporter, putative [Yarrowia lipolytica]|eukprot:XP_503291.1 YALI0D25828p [Yarrowia lipolytica CLIB122]